MAAAALSPTAIPSFFAGPSGTADRADRAALSIAASCDGASLVLRVAPLLPSPTLRAVARGMPVGTGKQAHCDRTGKLSLDVTDLNRASPPPQPVMHFYSGPPKQFLSGVDTGCCRISRSRSGGPYLDPS